MTAYFVISSPIICDLDLSQASFIATVTCFSSKYFIPKLLISVRSTDINNLGFYVLVHFATATQRFALTSKLLVVIRNRTSLIRWSVPIQTGSDYKMRE